MLGWGCTRQTMLGWSLWMLVQPALNVLSCPTANGHRNFWIRFGSVSNDIVRGGESNACPVLPSKPWSVGRGCTVGNVCRNSGGGCENTACDNVDFLETFFDRVQAYHKGLSEWAHTYVYVYVFCSVFFCADFCSCSVFFWSRTCSLLSSILLEQSKQNFSSTLHVVNLGPQRIVMCWLGVFSRPRLLGLSIYASINRHTIRELKLTAEHTSFTHWFTLFLLP